MKKNLGYLIFDRRHLLRSRRRRRTTDLCIDTYRPLLVAITLSNRLLQLLLMLPAVYLIFLYEGYEMKLVGLAGLFAIAGNFIVDKSLGQRRREGVTADSVHRILFMLSIIIAAVPAFAFLLTSGNPTAVSTYGIREFLYLCATSAAIIPSVFLLITLWWGAFVIFFKEKNLQQAERLKANQL